VCDRESLTRRLDRMVTNGRFAANGVSDTMTFVPFLAVFEINPQMIVSEAWEESWDQRRIDADEP